MKHIDDLLSKLTEKQKNMVLHEKGIVRARNDWRTGWIILEQQLKNYAQQRMD